MTFFIACVCGFIFGLILQSVRRKEYYEAARQKEYEIVHRRYYGKD